MNQITYAGTRYAPSKIICVGRNYVEHINELHNELPEELVLFIKPNSALADELFLPTEKCRYEGEICFLFKAGAPVAAAFGLDLTLPEVQNRLKSKGLPWEKAKAFDHSAVFTEFVPVPEIDTLRLELWINGALRQEGGMELMIHKPAEIMAEIAKWFTLKDYDIVMTGTPKGVGELNAGDVLVGKLFAGTTLLMEKEWRALNLSMS